MSVNRRKKPRCCQCAKLLEPWTEMRSTQRRLLNPVATAMLGEPTYDLHTVDEDVATGKYGYGGDGLFCDLGCAYRYARWHAVGEMIRKVVPRRRKP